MIVWALFDSGNGCYKRSADEIDDIEIYSIGLDIENKNNHFINLNLADYSRLFGDNTLFNTLDKLPQPDLIIASPPCESWSVASAMKNGNACWKREDVSDSLFEPQTPLSRFTVRNYTDYDGTQFKQDKSLIKLINGELCAFNTVEIIKKYNPKYYIIENPAHGRLWEYVDKILGFKIPFDNFTYYNNYDYPISKPTKFKSNVKLNLKSENIPNDVIFNSGFSSDYNERSNIPKKLVDEIFSKILKMDDVWIWRLSGFLRLRRSWKGGIKMTKKQNSISSSWLYVIIILLCLFGAVTFTATLETNKLKREQIRIYNRINNLERALTTKDKELERYLIKEKMKWKKLVILSLQSHTSYH